MNETYTGKRNVKNSMVSFVIPCYNSEKTLSVVVSEIKEKMSELKKYDYEVILVNDNSPDGTFSVIQQLSKENHNVLGIDLARNFGQHSALMAGFHFVSGEFIVCLDDDGQMPIEAVGDMLSELENGVDVVQGKYVKTKQNLFRRFGSWVNSVMTEWLLEKPKNLELNSFWGSKRFVIDEIIKYEGAYPYIAGLVLRTTKNIKNIEVNHRERLQGESGYNFRKLFFLWMNGFTAFSEKPLRVASFCGFLCSVAGIIFAIVTVVRKILNPDILVGYSSLITVILFIGGMIMMLLGMLGEYIGRMYICMNRSPQYVIRQLIQHETTSKDMK
jgi:undecaprenyl-phosphate 4-deoxy-4-formamido-L-arabinose transferase